MATPFFQLVFYAFCSLFLLACSSIPIVTSLDHEYLLDNEFDLSKAKPIESKDEIFELDDDIIADLSGRVSYTQSPRRAIDELVEHVIGRPNDDIIYTAAADLTASQTYRSKTANCLSLSIMTYALAKHSGLQAEFQEVKIPELWTSRDGFRLANGHVNVKIRATQYSKNIGSISYIETLDFAPEIAREKFKTKTISKKRVQALFYNNKAAHAIIEQDYDTAYNYLKAALNLAPNDSPTWSNLGLVYKKKGFYQLAEKVYQQAIKIAENNLTPQDNLASLYYQTGRNKEADALKRKLAIKRKSNPYYHSLQGDIAYDEGNMQQAIKHFRKAISLNNQVDIFYFGMAKAHFELGDLDSTRRYLNYAKNKSQFSSDTNRYQAKLNALRRLAKHD